MVWLTGVPSSGKSTLARQVAQRLPGALLLDSDEVRAALVPEPGYDPKARDAFYTTLANLAALLAKQGHRVLVPATAHKRAYREHARRVAPRFCEVYVEVSREEAERRDAKGLYAAVREGSVRGVPGADVEYEAPVSPDVVARGGKDADAVQRILEVVDTAGQQPQS